MYEFIIASVLLLIFTIIYLSPSIWMHFRDASNRERLVVFIINLLLGWTVVVWVLLLLWIKWFTDERF